MVDAMSEGNAEIVNVHLHDTISVEDPYVDTLIEKYPLEEDGELIEWRERSDVYTHLPPGEGTSDIEGVVSKLREVDYDGPLTLELYSRFKNQEGWETSQRTLENI